MSMTPFVTSDQLSEDFLCEIEEKLGLSSWIESWIELVDR